MRRQFDDLLDVVFPPVCGLCGKPADSEDRLVCNKCWAMIQGLEAPYCSGCRQLLYNNIRCPECRTAKTVIFSLGSYEGHLQKILHDLKFSSLKPLAGPIGEKLAGLIAPRLNEFKIDLLLPVPLHESRRNVRGFNQSEEISGVIGRQLDLEVRGDILFAVRKTKQQARLPAHQREANVRGAFAVDDDDRYLKGKTVLLVDDVTTTGATLRENERILKQASAGRVVAAVAATAV